MVVNIINADVMDGLKQLPDNSIHCVITSPPYYKLRDYGIDGQIGLEDSPEEYINRLVEVFREVKRVLRNDGIFWLNIGDSYASISSNNGYNIKHKDLMGIPWRLALSLQQDGWYLRSDIIWHKPNCMPSSVKDRPTSSHEYVFMLTKQPRYFYDWLAVAEPAKYAGDRRGDRTDRRRNIDGANRVNGTTGPVRNLRDVWVITTQPYRGAHFATFPEELVRRCISAGTSSHGCCSICGNPHVRIIERGEPLSEWKRQCGADSNGEYNGTSEKWLKQDALGKSTYTGFNARWKLQNASDVKRRILEGMKEYISHWEPGCTCNADTVPCTVLDPFAGSGTVGKVAQQLGRNAILIELNTDYIELIRERISIDNNI